MRGLRRCTGLLGIVRGLWGDMGRHEEAVEMWEKEVEERKKAVKRREREVQSAKRRLRN